MLTRWLPWRYVISLLAKRHRFLDPLDLLTRLHGFAQPSEVAEPIELLRAGVVFHARGLINTKAIQHNLDWVWPYWVERQFDPHDESFVPRAFSITHTNLTQRNWTAVGLPDCDRMPLVDAAGLLTPLYDGWSIDVWVLPSEGPPLLPSRTKEPRQELLLGENLVVETKSRQEGCRLKQRVEAIWEEGQAYCQLAIEGASETGGFLAVALRPYNPEGISFINRIQYDQERREFTVDEKVAIQLDRAPAVVSMSDYRQGDVLRFLQHEVNPPAQRNEHKCAVGLATAAALFALPAGESLNVELRVPLAGGSLSEPTDDPLPSGVSQPGNWEQSLENTCRLQTPDAWMNFLFDAAARNLVLHSPGEVYPGPYTYKRFWFRDAAFVLDGLLALGMADRVERCLELFPERQTAFGYFHSQEGEWDSNGEALWILEKFQRQTGRALSPELLAAVKKGVRWIGRKRLSDDLEQYHAGLLPAGFSAEHLGPNDFYYWDDFWSIAGLEAAARLLRENDQGEEAVYAERVAQKFREAIDRSLKRSAAYRDYPGIAASPYRRMDAGAIGSLAGSYPLGVWEPEDERMLATVDFLLENCTVRGGFFQDMIHSGINAYLTLHMAQTLLRAGDPRFWPLVQTVADLASPTGQWPEAIHPRTGGGCMGDGQHIWAAAEWVLMLRNCFVREEGAKLILASGLPPAWLEQQKSLVLGPTPTSWGPITVTVEPGPEETLVSWQAEWWGKPPAIEVRLAGHETNPSMEQAPRVAVRREQAISQEVSR